MNSGPPSAAYPNSDGRQRINAPAEAVAGLEDRHPLARAQELAAGHQSRGAGSHDQDMVRTRTRHFHVLRAHAQPILISLPSASEAAAGSAIFCSLQRGFLRRARSWLCVLCRRARPAWRSRVRTSSLVTYHDIDVPRQPTDRDYPLYMRSRISRARGMTLFGRSAMISTPISVIAAPTIMRRSSRSPSSNTPSTTVKTGDIRISGAIILAS